MPYDVFISHSSIDKPVADAAVAVLERSRIRCWVAPRDIIPGADWGASIIQGIRGSRLMLIIFSSHSNASDQVKREVERAVHQGIPIIPLRIENIQPTGSMEFFLSTPHWLDALSSPLEAHLEQLARTVHLLLNVADQPAPAPTPAWTAPAPAPTWNPAPSPAPTWNPEPAPAQAGPQYPTWAPATATGPSPAPARPGLPGWLIAVIVGGLVALAGGLYLARGLFEPAGPKIASVQFFESGMGPMPKARRSYSPRFANSGTRYVNFELNLEYPKSTTESKFDLETKWFKPDGSPETTQNQVVVLPAGTTTVSVANGWGNADGKYYHAGMYSVEFYLAGKKLGGSKFEIYEGEAPPSGYIQSLDAVVGPILFYESATGRIAKDQRVYQTRFSRSARYLNWEVHLTFPKPASHTAFTIHEIWHRPDGALEKEQDFLAYIEPTWDNSTHSSEGWGSAKGGWIPGTYRVDFYVDKRRVVAGSFEIVE